MLAEPTPIRRSSTLHAFLLISLVACASTRGRDCNHNDDVTTSQPTTSPTTTSPTSAGTAGDIDDADVADLDRAVTAVLGEVYGRALRSAWKREDGPGSVVFTLEYGLDRPHTAAAADALQAGLVRRGFTIDRVLADAEGTTVFAAREGFPVIVALDVGAKRCVVSSERAGP